MDKKNELEENNQKLKDSLAHLKRRGAQQKPRDPFRIVEAVLKEKEKPVSHFSKWSYLFIFI